MNHNIHHKGIVPETPNIDAYKLKNKSKSRRKNGALPITNPLTPKISKVNINLKRTNDKHL